MFRVQMLKGSKKKKGEIAPVLPQMVKQVEVTLYRSASSFEAYIDKSTLKDRLQAIAREISNDSGDDAGNHLLKNLERSSHPSTNSGMPNYPQDGQNSTRSTQTNCLVSRQIVTVDRKCVWLSDKRFTTYEITYKLDKSRQN